MVVHAAGLERADDYRDYANALAREGVAVLAFDLQGAGASTGNAVLRTFDELAQDVLAGVEFLRGRNDIDPQRIGLWSLSRGGLVVPLVATRSTAIAFSVLVSPVVLAPLEHDTWALEKDLRAAGISEAERGEAVGLYRLGMDFARTGNGYERLSQAFVAARSKRWFSHLPVTQLPPADDPSWSRFGAIVAYDPAPLWKKVSFPVLAVFGAKDTALLVERNSAQLAAALEKGKNGTIRVLADADHLMHRVDAEPSGAAAGRVLSPSYRDVVASWLSRHGIIGSRSRAKGASAALPDSASGPWAVKSRVAAEQESKGTRHHAPIPTQQIVGRPAKSAK